MEDNCGVVAARRSAERPLVSNRYRVDNLWHHQVNERLAHKHGNARTLECPMISPVEEPLSIMNACPNLRDNTSVH